MYYHLGYRVVCVRLLGLSGAKDYIGVQKLLHKCMLICVFGVGAMSLVVQMFPELFFKLHGVYNIPEGGIMSLRLFALYFVFDGFDALFQLVFVNRMKSQFLTIVTVVSGVIFVVIAYVFVKLLPPPYVWLAYLVTTLLVVGVETLYYQLLKRTDREQEEGQLLYLSVKPDEAVNASRLLNDYVISQGYSPYLANKLSLCMEEMVAYAVNKSKKVEIRRFINKKVSPELFVEILPDELLDKLRYFLRKPRADEPIPQFPGEVLKRFPKELQLLIQKDIEAYIIIRLETDEARFIMIDTGRRIALNEDRESRDLVTENYTLIKKISKSVEYQYVLDMNYTVITV